MKLLISLATSFGGLVGLGGGVIRSANGWCIKNEATHNLA